MTVYQSNIIYLCDQHKMTITEFENKINIPKVRIHDPYPPELLRIAEYFNLSTDILLKKDLKAVSHSSEQEIKLIILDVDGTLTDGGMYFTENGDQFKKYNTKDGMAIKEKIKAGFRFGIISHSHKSKTVEDRAEMLGIQNIYVGHEDKLNILENWCGELKITLKNVAYVGDDINDISVMEKCGLSACPSDAVESVKKVSHIILTRKGGDACVREFLDEWIQ